MIYISCPYFIIVQLFNCRHPIGVYRTIRSEIMSLKWNSKGVELTLMKKKVTTLTHTNTHSDGQKNCGLNGLKSEESDGFLNFHHPNRHTWSSHVAQIRTYLMGYRQWVSFTNADTISIKISMQCVGWPAVELRVWVLFHLLEWVVDTNIRTKSRKWSIQGLF